MQTIEATPTGYLLRMPLPLASREQLDLLQTGDELVVQVGDYKRNIILPRALASLQIIGAKLENGELRSHSNGLKVRSPLPQNNSSAMSRNPGPATT